MVLTVFSALRGFHLPVKVDTSPITNPSKSTDCGSWESIVPHFWRVLRKLKFTTAAPPPQWGEFHFSLKAGPSGGPAILSALSELRSLPGTLLESIGVVGGPVLRQKMADLLEILPILPLSAMDLHKENPGGLRKVVGIEDKEGKTRVIAIGDYWSQTALYRLHLWCFSILRMIPQDMTFTQGTFVDHLRKWGPGVVLYSVDLTAATDRFPIKLISSVLKGALPCGYVDAWVDIMVGYPFRAPSGEEVRYSVGNPMGFYSSWACFALAHHFIMFWCCNEVGIKWSSAKYVILGDDVLIGNVSLGEAYRKKILTLGIEVSEQKSFTSRRICEFAKRFQYEGQEVTPFPVSSLVDNLGDVSLLYSSISGEEKKGFVTSSGVPNSIGNLARFLGRRKSLERNWVLRARDSELATSLFQGTLEPGQFAIQASNRTDEAFLD